MPNAIELHRLDVALHDLAQGADGEGATESADCQGGRRDPGGLGDCVRGVPHTICKKHSASFDLSKMRAPQQAFEFGSDEWNEFHDHAYNGVESENSQLKASGDEDIETAGRRRVRGVSAAQIMVTLLLVNHDIRKIAAFLSDKMKEDAKAAPADPHMARALRRRDRAWANKYTKTTGDGDLRTYNTKELRGTSTRPPLRT